MKQLAAAALILVSSTLDAGAVVDDVRLVDARTQDAVSDAFIVRPESTPVECAGILFIHWFAPPDPTSNRTQFVEEA